MFDMGKVKSVLLVMPVSLISHWMSELDCWAPGLAVYDYNSCTKDQGQRILAKVCSFHNAHFCEDWCSCSAAAEAIIIK